MELLRYELRLLEHLILEEQRVFAEDRDEVYHQKIECEERIMNLFKRTHYGHNLHRASGTESRIWLHRRGHLQN